MSIPTAILFPGAAACYCCGDWIARTWVQPAVTRTLARRAMARRRKLRAAVREVTA